MTVADFLSIFAARRASRDAQSERLRAAARRFAALVAPLGMPAGSTASEDADSLPRALLIVRSGFHRGASLELTASEYLIGSDEDCDIVLRDAGVAPRHCRLVRAAEGISLHDVRAAPLQPVPTRTRERFGGTIESTYDIGGIVVALLQREPELGAAARADSRRRVRSPMRLFARALSVALVLTAIAFAGAHRLVEQMTPALAERTVAGSAAAAAHGFDTVRFRRGVRGELEVAGLVADKPEQERLRGWLARADYGDARFNVQQATALVEQVRQTLAGEDLQIGFHDGRLRIEGTTRQLPIKRRIRMLADELRGVVEIDDRVAYVDGRESPRKPAPLPVRIRDVMIGNPSYFRTDTGARYYEGALLPDGAEVLTIEAERIRFRRDDREIVYDLD